ncbi:glutathione S-transferase 1 [Phthorimaea operculella]|nr:glutathione S-transferase 1 [Phthorimaea operculella]
MPKINLYSIAGSPPCRAVLMVIEALGLDVNIKLVNTIAGDQLKPEFVEKNPLHTVPLLEEDDFLLADSHAIITYLVSKYGADKRALLYPADMRVRATVDQRMYFDTGVLFGSFKTLMMSLIKEKATEVSNEMKAPIEEAYGFLEKYLERSPFVAADHVTVADIACIATVSTLNIFVPIDEKYVKIHEWWNKLKQFDWYEKGNAEGLVMIQGFIQSMLNK